MKSTIEKIAATINSAGKIVAFTGAGISVESGIPSFRGSKGLWSKYDPNCLDLENYFSNTQEAWRVIKEIFYDFFGKAKPNKAHHVLAEMEQIGLLNAVITQNIDNLHQEAGSKKVIEFHGNSKYLIDIKTHERFSVNDIEIGNKPPVNKHTGNLLKPDFIFFGEGIPDEAYKQSVYWAENADVFILVGTTGEVVPASYIPPLAKRNGAVIIEINPEKSNYTSNITDIFLQMNAVEAFELLSEKLVQ